MSLSRQPSSEQPLEFFMGGKPLQRVQELNILGVKFSRSLGFQSHVNSIADRAGQRVSALRSIAPCLNPQGRARVYKAHVRSTMEYAPLAWMSASTMHLKKLDDVQRRAVRIIKAPPQELKIDPLSHRRTVAGLGLMYRLHTEGAPALLKTMLPPARVTSRSTRASSSLGSFALQGLTGRAESGHWSLAQHDRSFIPAMVPVWNSLPDAIVGHPTTTGTKAFCSRTHNFLNNL